jgi:DNA-binding beta-propeller fold protein YncE
MRIFRSGRIPLALAVLSAAIVFLPATSGTTGSFSISQVQTGSGSHPIGLESAAVESVRNLSYSDPYVLASSSLCSGRVYNTTISTYCSASFGDELALDPGNHLLFLANSQQCLGCDSYVIAYNDSTDTVVWSNVTGAGGLGNGPDGLTYVAESNSVYVSDFGSYDVAVISARNGTGVASIRVLAPGAQMFDPTNGYLYVSDQTAPHSNVTVIDTANNTVVARFPCPAPVAEFAFDASTGMIIATAANEILVIDPANDSIVTTLGGMGDPFGLYYDAHQGKIFVSKLTGGVTVLNSTNYRVDTNLTGGIGDSTAFAFDSENSSLYVTTEGGSYIGQINPVKDTVKRLVTVPYVLQFAEPVAQPFVYDAHTGNLFFISSEGGLESVNPASKYRVVSYAGPAPTAATFYARTGTLYIADAAHCDVIPVNLTHLTLGTPIFAGCGPTSLALDTANGVLYVSDSCDCTPNLYAINVSTGDVVGSWNTEGLASGIAYDSTDQRLFVVDYYNVSVLNTANGQWTWDVFTIPGGIYSENENGYLTWTPDFNRLFITWTNNVAEISGESFAVESTLKLRGLLYGTAFDPNNNKLYIAQYADQASETDNVSIANATTLNVLETVRPCEGPDGILYDSSARRVYVACESGNLGIIDTSNETVKSSVSAPAGATVDAITLADGLLCLLGETAGSLTVISPGSGWYDLQFAESGLPLGHSWTVSWGATTAASNQSNILFLSQNLSGEFKVSALKYTVAPASGMAALSGSNETVAVTFTRR